MRSLRVEACLEIVAFFRKFHVRMKGTDVKNRFDASKPMQVVGQAVIEGVMRGGPGMIATAVRRSNGAIVVRKEQFVSLAEKYRLFKLPLLRGAVGLVEMMVIGIRSLNFSAEIAMEDAGRPAGMKGDGGNGTHTAPKKSWRENLGLGLIVVFSLLVGIAIFFITPLFVTTQLFSVEQDPLRFNLIAGGIRIILLMVYLIAISLMKDIQRLFQYHGGEHKAVFAFELGASLDVPSAMRQSRFHPRCGTSFLLIVMLVAIVSFSILDAVVIQFLGSLTIGIRLLTHLPLIPLVGGISYEFIKASAKRSSSKIGRIIVAPGLWLQKITTKEPDEGQIEVALVALRTALGEEFPSPVTAQIISSQPISVN